MVEELKTAHRARMLRGRPIRRNRCRFKTLTEQRRCGRTWLV